MLGALDTGKAAGAGFSGHLGCCVPSQGKALCFTSHSPGLSDLFRDLDVQLGIKLGRRGPPLLPEPALGKEGSGLSS